MTLWTRSATRPLAGVILALASLAGTPRGRASAAVIRLDPTRQYQVIDGLGAFGAIHAPWVGGPFHTDEFIRLVIDDLGLTISRDEVPPQLELENDNDDPSGLDLGRFNLTQNGPRGKTAHRPLADHFPYLHAMKDGAARSGEPFRLIASIWSPPWWMKYVGNVVGTDHQWNRLKMQPQNDCREELAEYCVAYCKIMEREGLPVYALSIQNEPFFAQTYVSCVYSPEQLRDAVKVVGRRFRREGIRTKLFMPEDVSTLSRIKHYIQATMSDDEAREYVEIVAVHGYSNDGVTRDTTTEAQWAGTFGLARRYNKPLWMTETSGYSHRWEDAFRLGLSIQTALRHGKIGAWVWWQLSGETKDERAESFVLMSSGTTNKKYHVSKQFYRFVRPGAVQIGSASTEDEIVVTAFTHRERKSMAVVLINTARDARRVRLTGHELPARFKVVRTSRNEDAKDVGEATRALELPAMSVSTLFAEGYEPPRRGREPPEIVEEPEDVTVEEGGVAEFTALVNGPYPYDAKWQWKRNGKDLPGETFTSLVVKNVRGADDGALYHAVCSNRHGSAASRKARLTIRGFDGVEIPRAGRAPAVDGRADAVWQGVKEYRAANDLGKGAIGGPADLSAVFKAVWDAHALYLFVDVTDDARGAANKTSFETDSVEVYLDGDNSKAGNYDANDFQFIFLRDGSLVEEVKRRKTDGARFKAADTPKGYAVEISLPWALIGVSPREGAFVGLDVHVNDSDARRREGKIGWFAKSDNVWEVPSRMGTAKLGGR